MSEPENLPHEYVKPEGAAQYICKHCGVPTLNAKLPPKPCPARPAP